MDIKSSIAYRVSGFNRRRKWELFLSAFQPTATHSVLDVGFSNLEYSGTDNFLEKNYPHPEMITALGVETPTEFQPRYPMVRAVEYDGAAFPFEDDTFDIAWSNAVLEHVGTHATRRDSEILFLTEIARVSKRAFVTTPNRWFPVEVHTRTPILHWLPKRFFDRYLHARSQEWAAGDYMDLLSVQDLRDVLRAAGITRYRIVYNRLFGMTLDFVVMFGDGV